MVGVMTEHPPVRQSYAAFSNQGFLLREVGLVAGLLLTGTPKEEVRRDILERDLFQLDAAKSRQTLLRAVLWRLDGAPPALLEFSAHGSLELRRLTNLYLLLLQHRLLREFLAEVVLESLDRFSYLVPPTEAGAFMTRKRDESADVGGWSEATLAKARSNLVNFCLSAGLLTRDADGYGVHPQSVPGTLRDELIAAGRRGFLRLLLDPETL